CPVLAHRFSPTRDAAFARGPLAEDPGTPGEARRQPADHVHVAQPGVHHVDAPLDDDAAEIPADRGIGERGIELSAPAELVKDRAALSEAGAVFAVAAESDLDLDAERDQPFAGVAELPLGAAAGDRIDALEDSHASPTWRGTADSASGLA